MANIYDILGIDDFSSIDLIERVLKRMAASFIGIDENEPIDKIAVAIENYYGRDRDRLLQFLNIYNLFKDKNNKAYYDEALSAAPDTIKLLSVDDTISSCKNKTLSDSLIKFIPQELQGYLSQYSPSSASSSPPTPYEDKSKHITWEIPNVFSEAAANDGESNGSGQALKSDGSKSGEDISIPLPKDPLLFLSPFLTSILFFACLGVVALFSYWICYTGGEGADWEIPISAQNQYLNGEPYAKSLKEVKETLMNGNPDIDALRNFTCVPGWEKKVGFPLVSEKIFPLNKNETGPDKSFFKSFPPERLALSRKTMQTFLLLDETGTASLVDIREKKCFAKKDFGVGFEYEAVSEWAVKTVDLIRKFSEMIPFVEELQNFQCPADSKAKAESYMGELAEKYLPFNTETRNIDWAFIADDKENYSISATKEDANVILLTGKDKTAALVDWKTGTCFAKQTFAASPKPNEQVHDWMSEINKLSEQHKQAFEEKKSKLLQYLSSAADGIGKENCPEMPSSLNHLSNSGKHVLVTVSGETDTSLEEKITKGLSSSSIPSAIEDVEYLIDIKIKEEHLTNYTFGGTKVPCIAKNADIFLLDMKNKKCAGKNQITKNEYDCPMTISRKSSDESPEYVSSETEIIDWLNSNGIATIKDEGGESSPSYEPTAPN